MTRPVLFFVTVVVIALFPANARAQPAGPSPNVPLAALPSSPVDLFRKLLATNAAGREQWLAIKPAPTRTYVEAKLREYETMPPEQREARLQALQLRWFMRYFMQMNPVERTPRLASVPEPDRTLLRQQLGQWDILPPPLKKDVLENENLIRIFGAAGQSGNSDNILPTMTEEQKSALGRQYEHWNRLPPDRKEQILARFRQFIELRDAEKNRVVATLTETERTQMEKTLSKFSSLPKEELEQAMQGFKKFAELAPLEQAAFLKTAERWKAMSESEKQLWRKVVASLQTKRIVPFPSLPPPARLPVLSSTN